MPSTQTTYTCNDSNYSTPINSPYQTTQIGECESAMGTNAANLCMSQNMILDPAKVVMLFYVLWIDSCFHSGYLYGLLKFWLLWCRNVLPDKVYVESIRCMTSQTWLHGSQMINMTSHQVHLSRILEGTLNFLVISVAMALHLPSQMMETTWNSIAMRIFRIKVITRATYWEIQISSEEHWGEIGVKFSLIYPRS